MPYLSDSLKDEIRIVLGYPPVFKMVLPQLDEDYPQAYIDRATAILEQLEQQSTQTDTAIKTQITNGHVKKMEDIEFFSPSEYVGLSSRGKGDLLKQLSQLLGLPSHCPVESSCGKNGIKTSNGTLFQYQ